MNKIVLLGWLIKDPELRTTESNDEVFTKFIIGVERNYKLADGIKKVDFIRVVLWGKKAEVACKYLKKGDTISLSGKLRTDSYEDKLGNRKYIAEVIVDDFNFIKTKKYSSDENKIAN